MRRISLSVLAGVALLSAAGVLLHSAGAGVSQPVLRASARLVPVAPSGLTPRAAPGLPAGKSGPEQLRAQFLSTLQGLTHPAAHRPTTVLAPPLTRPLLPQGMACPAANRSGAGGCSIVPCAIYVGAGPANYTVTSAPGAGLSILPKLIPAPSPGGRPPAGTCVSRPGRPPHMLWIGSAGR